MKATMKVTEASRNAIITKSGFKNYDVCANPYVGCQFGCSYCYVRFFVKDSGAEWGDFVRYRSHIKTKFPKELAKNGGMRMVIGTMTDPYQPIETKYRLTRSMLESILKANPPLNKVGIFTRSPLIEQDIDLIAKLPRARVHFTVSPYEEKDVMAIEPIAIRMNRRFETMKKLKAAGIRVHASVAPVIPIMSESVVDRIAQGLAEVGADEFFVDPMQAYGPSYRALEIAMGNDPRFPQISEIILDKPKYKAWKLGFKKMWEDAWAKHGSALPDTLPIWSDHERKTWIDMRTNTQMNIDRYGDDV